MQKTLFLWTSTLIKKILVGKDPAYNVNIVRLGPGGDAKNISNLLFISNHLFISDEIINEIITDTNDSVSDFCECVRDILPGNILIVQLQIRSI